MRPVESRAHGNRIGAGERPPPADRRFEVLAAEDGASLGSWPRSGAQEVEEALEALLGARESIDEISADERLQRARSAAGTLAEDPALAAWLSERFAVTEAELEPHRLGLADRVEGDLGARMAGEGLCVLLPDWSGLLGGVVEVVLGALAQGRPALLLADPRAPALADAVADAAVSAGLPAEALALIHGADSEALRAAVRAPAVTSAAVSGSPQRLAEVEQAAAARSPADPLEWMAEACCGVCLDLGVDAAGRAAEVVDRAFGRARTFSGQLPGRLETVRLDPGGLSAFTAALLEVLEDSVDVRLPVALVDGAAFERLEEARNLGLDEGATLIFGGQEIGSNRAPALRPMLFTNVDQDMALTRFLAPGPLLRLQRSP